MPVAEIWRYPVKSLKGERLPETEITKFGIPGDRQIAIVRTINGRFLTSRVRPKLLGFKAVLILTACRRSTVIAGIHGSAATCARSSRRAHNDPAGSCSTAFDVLPLLIATDGAARYLNIDHRRLRPNILIADFLTSKSARGRDADRSSATCASCGNAARPLCDDYVHPDTQEQDPSVLQRILQDLDGTTALDSSVITPGKIRVGDQVENSRALTAEH